MSRRAEQVDALRQSLPHLDWRVDPAEIKRKSLDYYWFSPILRRQLDGKLADAVVRPRNIEELRELVAECVRMSLPLTIRGGGTGNYGQCIPLQGGVVVEMTACDQLLWLEHGVARAQAGIKLGVLNDLLTRHRCELRCMPSTYRMATLGGLFCGGFGGIGSVTYGPLSAPGTILAVKLMTVEAEPRIVELRSPQAMQHAHAYGTNGIILELEMALAPAGEWHEYLLSFPDAGSAFNCGHALAKAPGIIKKEVAVFADSVTRYFKKLTSHLGANGHAVIAVVSSSNRDAVATLVSQLGGWIAWQQTAAAGHDTGHTLLEYCWNHTTLHALRSDKSLTYLQTTYKHGLEREQLACIDRMAGNEVLNHLEFIRDEQGQVVCAGLPLIRFTDEARLCELITLHREQGIGVKDPHVYTLEAGLHHGSLSPASLNAKRTFDPCGLLNPGKVRDA